MALKLTESLSLLQLQHDFLSFSQGHILLIRSGNCFSLSDKKYHTVDSFSLIITETLTSQEVCLAQTFYSKTS